MSQYSVIEITAAVCATGHAGPHVLLIDISHFLNTENNLPYFGLNLWEKIEKPSSCQVHITTQRPVTFLSTPLDVSMNLRNSLPWLKCK